MGQRGLLRTVFVERRTLSTVPMALRFRLVPPIRAHFVELECRAQLLWLEDEGLAERLNIARLGLPITLALQLPLLALQFLLVFVLAQPLLEEGRYGVGAASSGSLSASSESLSASALRFTASFHEPVYVERRIHAFQ